MKLDLLAIASHPDDAELCCGGLIALSVRQGLQVGILDLTEGEMGSRGTILTRREEAARSSAILGIAARHNLRLPDNGLNPYDPAQQQAVIAAIRYFRPDICLVSGPSDRHPDHNRTHQLVTEALFYAGLRKRETTWNGEPQQPWRPHHILLYHHDWPFEPDLVVDITPVISIKKDAVLAFQTQFLADGSVDEPATYISSQRFFDAKEAQMRAVGHRIGVDFGEAYQYFGGPIPFTGLGSLLLQKPVR
jgi:bacillithiol biosynthesis deacetylase BshB1